MTEGFGSSPSTSPLTSRVRDPQTSLVVGPDPDELPVEDRGREWATQLSREINVRAPLIWLLREYFDGIHPVRFATEAWRETFGEEFGPLVESWCRIVIEAATERMNVQGFRLSGPEPDRDAWRDWQRNRMAIDADIAHTDMLVTGYSYLMVWPGADGNTEITVEDPLHTIVETDPANRRRRLAGMKRWRQRDGTWAAFVFTPDHWWQLQSSSAGGGDWGLVAHDAHRLERVPIIPLVNCPDVYGRGYSDLQPMLPLQDAVNKLGSDEMIASEFAAYRQRVLLGVEVPTDPETGEAQHDLVGGINRWMAIEDADAKIQELSANDLSNYHGSIEQKVQHISALTRTPPHYLLGKVVNIAADALRAAETGLVKRTQRRCKFAGEGHVEAQHIARMLRKQPPSDDGWEDEVIWGDPETASESARVDALVKMKTLGIPDVILWERWGMSPQEIARATKLRQEQAVAEGLTLGATPSGAELEPPPQEPPQDDPAVEPPA